MLAKDGLDRAHGPCMQAQEEAELAQLQKAKRKALEQRDAQMRQLDDLKARILAERCPRVTFPLSM